MQHLAFIYVSHWLKIIFFCIGLVCNHDVPHTLTWQVRKFAFFYMSTLSLSGLQLWQTLYVPFSVALGLYWITLTWWSRGIELNSSYGLFESPNFLGSFCWRLWRWTLARYHNLPLKWRRSMFLWWEILQPCDNMWLSSRWMEIQIHSIWLHWEMGIGSTMYQYWHFGHLPSGECVTIHLLYITHWSLPFMRWWFWSFFQHKC